MTSVDQGMAPAPYEPRRPTLLATALFALWPVVLSLPMLRGQWLASTWSDQYTAGFAFHSWSAAWFHRLGHLPLWNPEIFGGMPFVAAGSGDIFYPTWLLRFVISTPAAEDIGFFVHYPLAGLFTYLLLRRLRVSWTGAVVGGIAYELSGLIASYPSPGHDGKLFCSTMLPLALLALVVALRDRRWVGYPLLTAAVALALLSHFQLAYYLLIAAGLFALYLTVEEGGAWSRGNRTLHLGLALAAVLLGYGIAALQILPFFGYIPFSPRAQGYHGFVGSTSFAIPWEHVPEFFVKNFAGWWPNHTYWGSNGLKLHSEYLGLPVVALAVLGAATRVRRRAILWLSGIGLLFLLISLGAGTPFYRLWWTFMPLVGKTRAPGMAFFVVAFVTATFAAFGTERLLRKDTEEGGREMMPLMIVGGVVAVLGILGVLGYFAESLAGVVQAATGLDKLSAARADGPAIMWGAFSSGLALAATGAVVALGRRRGPQVAALTLILVVGADLWLNARQFWSYMTPPGRDALIDRVGTTPVPDRVVNLNDDAYPGSVLMAFDIPEVLGSHGNELRYYDELLDRENRFSHLFRFLSLWDLLAVRYAVTPAAGVDSIPGFRRILDAVPASNGARARLFERLNPAPYARVVPAGIKADSATIIPTLLDARMDFARIVLFTNDQAVTPAPLKEMPPLSPSRAHVTTWEPGRLTVTLDPAPPQASYLLVAENWYPDWQAEVDGQRVGVLRGDYTFITVALPVGAKTVELTFRSRLYALGRMITLASLAAFLVALLVGLAQGRPRGG